MIFLVTSGLAIKIGLERVQVFQLLPIPQADLAFLALLTF